VVFGGILVGIDPHYLIIVLALILYKYQHLSDRIQILIKLLFISGLIVAYVYIASGKEAFKSIYINLLYITDGNESMSMAWYFYII